VIIEALLGEGMDVNYQVRSHVHFSLSLGGGTTWALCSEATHPLCILHAAGAGLLHAITRSHSGLETRGRKVFDHQGQG
jgi:hypothetical protein